MSKFVVVAVALVFALGGCGDGDDAAPAGADAGAPAEDGDMVGGMGNPASVHCEEQGGREETRQGPDGEHGVCAFEDGSECDSWAFYREECAPGEQQGS